MNKKTSVVITIEDIDAGTFYSGISLQEKKMFNLEIQITSFKVSSMDNHSKIIAQVDSELYNIPAIVAEQGAKKKIAAAYKRIAYNLKNEEVE